MSKDMKCEGIEYTDFRNEKLDEPNTIPPEMYNPKIKADINAIPDIEQMTTNVIELMDDLEKPEYKLLASNSFGTLLNKLYEKYDEEIMDDNGKKIKNSKYIPYKLINILSDPDRTPKEKHDDVVNMLEMFERLEKCKNNGANIQEEFELFREKLKERHVYPKFGGKEKFEKEINSVEPKKRHRRTKKTFRK
jgi:hypothetical protein